MKKKRFYRCSTSSKVGKAIEAYLQVCADAEKKAQQFAEKYGAAEYLESPIGMAGGVAMLVAASMPSHGEGYSRDVWREVDVKGVGLCLEPNVPNDFKPDEAIKRDHVKKPLTKAEEIELERLALPVVSEMQLVAILQPKEEMVNGKPVPLVMSETPSVFFCTPSALSGKDTIANGEQWYISVPFEAEVEGLISIPEKEFYRRRMATKNVS